MTTTVKRYPYRIEIDWNAEENIYLAKIPDLPGLIASGDTYEAALKTAVDFIPLFHDVMREEAEYLKRLEKALEFYANPKKRIGLIKSDMGAVAREALSKKR